MRVATVALTLTGMSYQLAKFQARSAFTGAGFTTNESERVVNHPVRRRIIMLLMLLGNAGIVTAMASLTLSVVTADEQAVHWWDALWVRLLLIGLCVSAVWTIAQSSRFEYWLSRVIRWALKKWTDLEVRDYAALLHLAGEYHVTELAVTEASWLAGQTLQALRLAEEGLLVLGIDRSDGSYIGAAPRNENQARRHPADLRPRKAHQGNRRAARGPRRQPQARRCRHRPERTTEKRSRPRIRLTPPSSTPPIPPKPTVSDRGSRPNPHPSPPPLGPLPPLGYHSHMAAPALQ